MAIETLSSAAVNKILQGVQAPSTNTAAVPANSNYALPIYDKDGNLIGYIPVFSTEWS